MKRNFFVILCFSVCFVVVNMLSSCKHEPIIPAQPEISFKSDVQPIIIANCTADGCHGSVNTEEFTLLTYDDVVNDEEGGVNKIYRVIKGGGDEMMPPAPKNPLNEEQIKLIYIWIQQGAKNN